MTSLSERCSALVREFDSQGWHRTATDVDRGSANWLVTHLRDAGVPASTEGFPFLRVDPEAAAVCVGDTSIHGVPLTDSVLPTRPVHLEGRLVSADPRPGDIALLQLDHHPRGDLLRAARTSGARAVVVAVDGYPGATTVLNAWEYEQPFGAPVVQVPAEAWTTLARAERDGLAVVVSVAAKRSKTTAYNVVGQLAGRDASLPPFVLLTPRSGWWYCAGERGGGIAALVELARELVSRPLRRSVVFLATTGHELGFIGAKRYLDRHPALAGDAAFWVHLGANVGASESKLVVRSADDDLLARARAAAFPGAEYQLSPAPVGEAGVVNDRGGRFVSLIGADFPRFHSTADRWPDAIVPGAIAASVEAVLRLLRLADEELDGTGAAAS